MERAIAARRRVCQAAALATVLLLGTPAGTPAHRIQAGKKERKLGAERPASVKLEAGGVVVEEECTTLAETIQTPPSPDAGTFQRAPCGALARRAADIVGLYAALLGPLPGKLLAVRARPMYPHPRASSAAGLITVSEDLALPADVPEYWPEMLPREVARQWIPGTAGSANSKDTWLAEVLPEYLAWRYLRQVNPEGARAMVALAMRDVVAGGARDVTAIPEVHGLGDRTRRMTQQRGMLVLRTLETVIDRERVDRVLPELLRRSGRHALSTALFEQVCEEVAGRDLSWFFRYYADGKEVPEIELRRLPGETPGVAAGEIVLKNFPVEGSVRVEMRARTAKGTVEHSVATRGEVTPFSVNVPAPALSIELDPDQRILRWTEAARRSKARSEVLAALPEPITRKNLASAIEVYRRALAADPDDASQRAQGLHERLGELLYAHDEWDAALAELEAATNGHSIEPFETYLCRGKAYLYRGSVQLHLQRPRAALEDARAGLDLPLPVLEQAVPREPVESKGRATLRQLLERLEKAARGS